MAGGTDPYTHFESALRFDYHVVAPFAAGCTTRVMNYAKEAQLAARGLRIGDQSEDHHKAGEL